MSRASPRVSLGLPVYNGERYLREALDSVLGQSFGDFELLISDNASVDATGEICRAYAARDRRIRYWRNDLNLGHAPNFRRVFGPAQAPYFKWVVHDDVLEARYLQACVEELDRAGASAVLAYPKTTLIDEQGTVLGPYEDRMDLRDPTPSRRLRRLLRDFHLGHCGLGLIRREELARTRLIGSYERSDLVMLAELVIRGEFREHPEFLYRRRIHKESTFGAYTTPQAFLERMDPRQRVPAVVMPRTKVIAEITRAIAFAPIGAAERLRCEAALVGEWGPRFWRVVGGEWKAWLLQPWRRWRALRREGDREEESVGA